MFGPDRLWRVLNECSVHYHLERNHQGKDKLLLLPKTELSRPDRSVGAPGAYSFQPSGGLLPLAIWRVL